jgi:hypothetical protein
MTKRAWHQEQSNHERPHQVIRQHVPIAVKLGVATVAAMEFLGLEIHQALGAPNVGEINNIGALALGHGNRMDFFTITLTEGI